MSKSPKNTARSVHKTTSSSWEQRVYLGKKTNERSNREWQSSNYFVRYSLHGVRKKVRLESTVQKDAGREALGE